MCDCIKETNESLKEVDSNSQLSLAMSIKVGIPDRVIISTYKIDRQKKKGPITLVASYCPFCGEKYVKDKADEHL